MLIAGGVHAQLANNVKPRLTPVQTGGEESLIEHINRVNPDAIREKGLTPEQADEAALAAQQFRMKTPAKAAYSGPALNQEFWFVMPQGTLLGYKCGLHYCTGGDGSVLLKAEDPTGNMSGRFNGAYVDGLLHTLKGDLTWVDYGLVIARDHIYDSNNNWQLYQSVNLGEAYYLLSQEVAVDPLTHRVYGTFLRSDYYTYDIAWVNYMTQEIHRIGPAQRVYPGLGMNSEGRLFGVDMDGVLYEISLEDGSDRVIGQTGIVVRDEDDRYFYQSAECGVRDNVLYWAAVLPDGASALYAINLETAEATKIHDFPKYTLAHCLTVPDMMADDGAPAAVTNLRASFEKTATSGQLSFVLPTTTYNGQALTGQIGYEVRVDGKETTTGMGEAGATTSLSLTLPEGRHFVEVYATNSIGLSAQACVSVFVGLDQPGQVQNPKLSILDDVATIAWEPAIGINGGYAGEMTYTVVRYPDGAVVAENISGTSLTDRLPLADWQRYYYGITASNTTQSGLEASTIAVAAGKPYELPYMEDFLTKADFLNNYTTFDANNDNVTWVTNISQQATYAVYTFNISERWTNIEADDWLFTPSFALKAGKTYKLTFTEACYGTDAQCINKLEVKAGRGANAEAMTLELLPVQEYSNNKVFNDVVVEFTVPADGNYNVGFHALSDPRKTDFILDALQMEEKTSSASPAAATNLSVTAATEGALSATVSFKAPAKTLGGAALGSLSKVRVIRQNKVLHTFENPAPGQALSFTDDTAVNGFNTYVVVATNDVSDGPTVSAEAYVGIDVPQFDYSSVGVEDNGDHITVKWAEVGETGLHGGYVNPAQVGYAVYNITYDIENGMMTVGDMINTVMGTDHLDVPTPTYEGDQRVVSYAIVAVNEIGADENHTGATYGMPIGQPYALPFIQSASNGRLSGKMMWAETENNPSAAYSLSADSYDKDNGSFEWMPADRSYTLSLNTGKISLAGANNPTLRFAHKGVPNTRYGITVSVQTPDREVTQLKAINYREITGTDPEWTLESIDLSDFKNEEYIVVKFLFSTTASSNSAIKGKSLLLDAVNVLDMQTYNLSVDIEAPEKIVAGQGDNINVIVHNVGERDAQGYSVKLFIDDEEAYAETISENISSLERRVVSVPYRPSVFGEADRITARAELTWAYDLVDEDNEMEEEIVIAAPTVPQPEEAYSQQESGGLSLTWKAPEQVAERVFDSFEGREYTDFDLCGITMENREGKMGDWTVWNLDGDGTWEGPHGATGRLPEWYGSQLEGLSFPNSGEVCAWMVFNQNLAVGSIGAREDGMIVAGTDTPITPLTGNKMAATFDDFVQQDTWLISPELSGRGQDVTFYAAAPATFNKMTDQPEVVEVIELLVSNGGLTPDDFVSLGTDTITTQEWHDYELELDEGAKYFAIRNVSSSYNALSLFVDDVTYERMSALPVSYNIYADEQLVANVVLGEPFKVDGRALRYAITAVYGNGDESLPVYFVDGAQGIADMMTDTSSHRESVFDLSGRRVMSPAKKGIYIIDGRKRIQ
ncbi:MAG: choice-of-anchor J domain-containing protein [Prevotella sp.]|nr:choice-of-anchor J domain-containing protein [Prevotella sp.]